MTVNVVRFIRVPKRVRLQIYHFEVEYSWSQKYETINPHS